MYGYTFNNPINYTDPNGDFIPILVLAIVAIYFSSEKYAVAPEMETDSSKYSGFTDNPLGVIDGAAALGGMTVKTVQCLAKKGIGSAKDLRIPEFLSPRQQLHIPPVTDARSVLTSNPAELLEGLHNGLFTILRQPKPGQVIVDFGKPIGEYWSQGVKVGETQIGSVMYGKNGVHIVPANPNQW